MPLESNSLEVEGGKYYLLIGGDFLEVEVLLSFVDPSGWVFSIKFWEGEGEMMGVVVERRLEVRGWGSVNLMG